MSLFPGNCSYQCPAWVFLFQELKYTTSPQHSQTFLTGRSKRLGFESNLIFLHGSAAHYNWASKFTQTILSHFLVQVFWEYFGLFAVVQAQTVTFLMITDVDIWRNYIYRICFRNVIWAKLHKLMWILYIKGAWFPFLSFALADIRVANLTA